MHPAVRLSLAVIAGAVVGFAMVAGIETVGHKVYPVPTGVDFSKSEQLKNYMQSLPAGALVFVLAAWLVATFVGGIVAGLIARARAGLVSAVVGALVLAATIANLIMIPHPTWVAVTGILGIVLAAWAAGKIMRSGSIRAA